ncbi:MAG: hypothetical protein HFI66_10060 [Lachnospiraceae bacterium]|nr:hypothetical protein [Lachnospiraceae bacterium]
MKTTIKHQLYGHYKGKYSVKGRNAFHAVFLCGKFKFCKGNRLEPYRFMEQHHEEFGVRWLLLRLALSSNAYYKLWESGFSALRFFLFCFFFSLATRFFACSNA